ncbi:hypothetical protein D3C87_1683350 [compost metagenome]
MFLEIRERLPAGAARVDHGGNAGTEGETVGWEGIRAIAVSLVHFGAEEVVRVHVDQARRYEKPFGIHHLHAFLGVDVFGDEHHRIAFQRDVHDAVDVVFGVNDVTALDHD